MAQPVFRFNLCILSLLIMFTHSSVLTAQDADYGEVTAYLDGYNGGMATGLGVGFVRLSFNWDQIQPTQGGPYNWPWSSVLEARNRGLQIFVTLSYTPAWANGGHTQNKYVPTATHMASWSAFCGAAAQTFQNDIKYYGMWNEPDSATFLSDKSKYPEIATTCANAIKAVNSSLKILGPEVSTGGVNDGSYSGWMNGFGATTFDIVTVHYYWGSANKWVDAWMDQKVKPYRKNKPVWMTETGRNYCDTANGTQQAHYQGVLERFQPRRSWWTKIFPYVLYAGNTNCTDAIVGPGGVNRPAYYTYRDWILSHP